MAPIFSQSPYPVCISQGSPEKQRFIIRYWFTPFWGCCCCCYIASVLSDSVRPHRQKPTRLLCPWDSPGKNTGVGSKSKICRELTDVPVCVSRLVQFSSVQFSCSVMSDSLRPHGLQHARPPYPSPTPRVYSNSCPLSR